MNTVHWYARALPNLLMASVAAAMAALVWKSGATSVGPCATGICIGLLDGYLGLRGRRENLPALRKADSFTSASIAYLNSSWTRYRIPHAIILMLVAGIFLAFKADQPVHATVAMLYCSYAGTALVLRALVLAPWGEPVDMGGGKASDENLVHVTFDDSAVIASYPSGSQRRISWADVNSIAIRTIDSGPFGDDLWWVLTGDGPRCSYPGGSAGELEALAEFSRRLPGFRSDLATQAMSSTDNATFVCWRRNPPGATPDCRMEPM